MKVPVQIEVNERAIPWRWNRHNPAQASLGTLHLTGTEEGYGQGKGDETEHSGIIGTSVPRLDAVEKVTGRAVYGVDVELPGMLYGATLRSPLPPCENHQDRCLEAARSRV